jgi:pilus assembly protein CpaE
MAVTRPLRGVLISSDPATREVFNHYARGSVGGFSLVLDLDVSLSAFAGTQFKSVQDAAPAVVFIDFDTSAELGLSLAHDLGKASDQLLLVGVGSALASDLLIQAIRAGLSEYLLKPVTEQGLAEAMERLRSKVAPLQQDTTALARTLAFFSAKGGSGTSTVVTNLGIELHRLTGKRTLIVDLDAQLGEIALLLGVQPQFNFVDLVQNFHRIDANLLASYIEQHKSGVHLLSAPFHPERAAGLTDDDIRQTLLYLRGHYDYVLVDTSKSFSTAAQATFEQADDVFLVTTVDLPSLRNIQRALPLLKRVMAGGLEQVHLIINRYDPSGEVSLKDVQRSVELPVYATLANDYESVIRSVNTSTPIVLNGSRSPYVRDIRGLAAKIVGVKPEELPPGGGGLFDRLRRTPLKSPGPGGAAKHGR